MTTIVAALIALWINTDAYKQKGLSRQNKKSHILLKSSYIQISTQQKQVQRRRTLNTPLKKVWLISGIQRK